MNQTPLARLLSDLRLSQAQLARRIGVTPGAVSHYCTGRLRVTAERAVQIELATQGAIQRNELRPDVFGAPH